MERSQESLVTLIGSDHVSGELATSAISGADVGEVVITDNTGAEAFELRVDGEAAAGLLYKKTGPRVTLLATSLFPGFRGKGIAGKLLVVNLADVEGHSLERAMSRFAPSRRDAEKHLMLGRDHLWGRISTYLAADPPT